MEDDKIYSPIIDLDRDVYRSMREADKKKGKKRKKKKGHGSIIKLRINNSHERN